MELIAYVKEGPNKAKNKGQNISPLEREIVELGNLEAVYDAGVLQILHRHHSSLVTSAIRSVKLGLHKLGQQPIRTAKPFHRDCKELTRQPPNLALNVEGAIPNCWETRSWAFLGILMQAVALMMPGIMKYHWHMTQDPDDSSPYAYPVFAAGSCSMIAGITMCSHIIETTTAELIFGPKEGADVRRIFRLQLGATMGDQHFQPTVILQNVENKCIRTSRISKTDDGHGHLPTNTQYLRNAELCCAVGLSLCGFICQFIGLRMLHWSTTIIQLGVVLVMTAIRSWSRRGLSRSPGLLTLPRDASMTWVALAVGTACVYDEWPPFKQHWSKARTGCFEFHTTNRARNLLDSGILRNLPSLTYTDPRIVLCRMLTSAKRGTRADIEDLVGRLERAIAACCRSLDFRRHRVCQSWTHLIRATTATGDTIYYSLDIEIVAKQFEVTWIPSRNHIAALIDLWTETLQSRWEDAIFDRCIAILHPDEMNRVLETLRNWIPGHQLEITSSEDQDYGSRTFGMSFADRSINVSPVGETGFSMIHHSVNSLQTTDLCALEIFSGFLHEAIQRLPLATYRKLAQVNRSKSGPLYVSPQLEKIAQTLVDCKLVCHMDEAKAVVYPPFVLSGKMELPCT